MPATYDVIVIGAGAAGLMAAITAAEAGRRTLLLEKNKRPGIKILMSGGTRCNLTQNTDNRGIIEAYGDQGRFLHSALSLLSPQDLVAFVEAEGVPTKIEETNKIFPLSDRAEDIVNALVARLQRGGAQLRLNEPVVAITTRDDAWFVHTAVEGYSTTAVIVTTGGLSYPGSGTTGDGFAWAEKLGHSLVPRRPALTPLTTNEDWVRELSGLTLPDVEVSIVASSTAATPFPPFALRKARHKDSVAARQRGSVLFTHFGLSGPAILDVSRAVTSHANPNELLLRFNFLPDISRPTLDEDLRTDAAREGKRGVVALLTRWIPRRLAEALCQRLRLAAELRGAELSKADRQRLIDALAQTEIKLSGALGYKKAEVTAGGVSLNEVDSRTMQSKLCPGLFFAGEVLDVDGPIGGYNFQAAFATGRLAGQSAAECEIRAKLS